MFKVKFSTITDLPWAREYRRRKERREYERLVLKEKRDQEWMDYIETIL